MGYLRNEFIESPMLPADIVLHPSWWHRHEGITFDEDFFYHPSRRVEVERKMEMALYERWGRFGLGEDHNKDLPILGPVHLAAGSLNSAMLGCRVDYSEAAPPLVVPRYLDRPQISPEEAFHSAAYRRFERLRDGLLEKYGYVLGDIGWNGVLNTALDLRGQDFFLDLVDQPGEAARFVADIATVCDRFSRGIYSLTGSTSISVNRNVRHIARPVHLHSECSHVMISVAVYERFLSGVDAAWGRAYRPYGIHYCGHDPHRYAVAFARLPHLDFLDVGWGGDVAALRRHLPRTFLNIRLSPVEIIKQTPDEIRTTIRELVRQSDNPWLTGICCINMDHQVRDEQITAIFEEVEQLRREANHP